MMDDNDVIIIAVAACVAAVHQFIAAYSILFDDVPTVSEKRLVKKHQRESLMMSPLLVRKG
jgi:hypothetical protein